MHFLYIIYSEKIDKFYIGETPDIVIRIKQHNQHYFKTNYTKSADDWKLVLEFQCENKSQAQHLERFIKRMKSRKFIHKLIQNPTILKDILDKK